MVCRILCLWAAASLLCVASQGAFQNFSIQYELYGCQGNNDLRKVARLSRVCEDCYALYKNQGIPVKCRRKCFNNSVFKECVESIEREHFIEELLLMAREIGQKPIRRQIGAYLF